MVDIKIDEIVKYVNEKMKNGLSMAQIEKEMKVGKDTLRKKFTATPWEGKFVMEDGLDVEIIKWLAHENKLFSKLKVEHNYPHCWRCSTPLVYYAKPSWNIEMTKLKDKLIENNNNIDITRSITKKETKENSNSIKNNVPEGHLFTEEEITILKNIIKNYKLCTTDVVLDGEIVTRSIRTYKNVLDRFAQYCKDNKLSQKDSIAIALIDFMKR